MMKVIEYLVKEFCHLMAYNQVCDLFYSVNVKGYIHTQNGFSSIKELRLAEFKESFTVLLYLQHELLLFTLISSELCTLATLKIYACRLTFTFSVDFLIGKVQTKADRRGQVYFQNRRGAKFS